MVLRGILIKRVLKRVENGTGEQRFWRAAKSQFLQLIRYFEMLLHICAIISQPQNVMTKTPILGQWYQARNARVCFYLWEQKISPLTSTATSHKWTQGSPSCKRPDDLQSWKSKWCRRLEEEDAEVASLSVSDLTQLTTTPPPDTDCPEWWSLCGNEPRG